MTVDDKLGELLDAATTEVPAGFLPAPVASIRARVRQRRGATVALAAAAVAVVVAGGLALGQRTTGPAGPAGPQERAATASPTAEGVHALAWSSAMVSRDGSTISVYAGPGDQGCMQLWQPQATVTEQDGTQVVIVVKGRVSDAADCSLGRNAIVTMVVTLGAPLGDRTVQDATTGSPHATYFENELPDLRSDPRWSPYASAPSRPEVWVQRYNGPNGTGLYLTAAAGPPGGYLPTTLATVTFGSHQGAITALGSGAWIVLWEVGDVTYSLQYQPTEGGAVTMDEFKQLLASLSWS